MIDVWTISTLSFVVVLFTCLVFKFVTADCGIVEENPLPVEHARIY